MSFVRCLFRHSHNTLSSGSPNFSMLLHVCVQHWEIRRASGDEATSYNTNIPIIIIYNTQLCCVCCYYSFMYSTMSILLFLSCDSFFSVNWRHPFTAYCDQDYMVPSCPPGTYHAVTHHSPVTDIQLMICTLTVHIITIFILFLYTQCISIIIISLHATFQCDTRQPEYKLWYAKHGISSVSISMFLQSIHW